MIVKMNKITLLGLENQRKALIKSLMELGVVEINLIDENDYREIARNPVIKDELSDIDIKLTNINTAIKSLDKFCPEKKGLFQSKRQVTISEFDNTIKNQDEIWKTTKKIKGAEERLIWLKAEENRLNNIIMSLLPWVDLTIPLEMSGTRKTVIQTGTIPSVNRIDDIQAGLIETAPCSVVNLINSDKELHYICLITHKDTVQECMSYLKAHGYNQVAFQGLSGTVMDNIRDLDKQLAQIVKDREETIEEIKGFRDERKSLEVLYDALNMEKSRVEASGRILETKRFFFISGWLPERDTEYVKNCLEDRFDVCVTITEPEEDEAFPVLLENNSIAEAGEPVSRMYSLPSSGEIDPNAVMTPFFIMFFGIMLGDAGYGIIIALAVGFVLWRFKLEENTRKFAKLLFLCGISTVFWGAMFGSWFGISSLTRYALWFDMVAKPELMLSYSFLFGVFHLLAGLAMKAANLIRRGLYRDALFDVGFWCIFFIGAILFLLPYAPEVNRDSAVVQILVNIGKVMLITGGILLILTQGRNNKNIFSKFFGGLYSLYNLVGMLSDVLSYSRLLALGLATGIISSILNQMAVMFELPAVIKPVAAVLILLIGHSINFAINALGAYVHSCRLQYLEFFGKFFEGGGTAFNPLKAHTKYITIKPDVIQDLAA